MTVLGPGLTALWLGMAALESDAPGPGRVEDASDGDGAADAVAEPPAAATTTEEPSAPPPTADPDVAGDDVAPPPTAEAQESNEEPAPDPQPAGLPAAPLPPPDPVAPRAVGGSVLTPLPKAPAAEDPSTITAGPWRGRGWLGLGLGVSVPVGGQVPAAGSVVAAVGEVTLGWRLNRVLALHTSLSSFAHDAAQRTVFASDGTSFEEVEFGRITAFDLVTARVFLPRPRRVEPWAELGVGVGIRRPAFEARRRAVGLARLGLGVDLWLAPSFTLGASASYRLSIIGDAVGHGLRTGVDLGVHW